MKEFEKTPLPVEAEPGEETIEGGENIPEEIQAGFEAGIKTEKSLEKKTSGWRKKLALVMAAATLFVLGQEAVNHFTGPKEEAPKSDTGEKNENHDAIMNATTKKIVKDFPFLSEPSDQSRAEEVSYVNNWQAITEAYEDGYIEYGGKQGDDDFILNSEEGWGTLIKIEQVSTPSRGDDSVVEYKPLIQTDKKIVYKAGDDWWKTEKDAESEFDQETFEETMKEFDEVSAGPGTDVDFIKSLRETVPIAWQEEALKKIEKRLPDVVDQGRAIDLINTMPGRDAWSNHDIWQARVEVVINSFESSK